MIPVLIHVKFCCVRATMATHKQRFIPYGVTAGYAQYWLKLSGFSPLFCHNYAIQEEWEGTLSMKLKLERETGTLLCHQDHSAEYKTKLITVEVGSQGVSPFHLIPFCLISVRLQKMDTCPISSKSQKHFSSSFDCRSVLLSPRDTKG